MAEGWTIISVGDDGSVLCQSPTGQRRRYHFLTNDFEALKRERDEAREAARYLYMPQDDQFPKLYSTAAERWPWLKR